MTTDHTTPVTAANEDPRDPLAAPGAPSPRDQSGSTDRAAGGTRTRAGSDYGDYAPDKHATTVYIEAGLAAAAQSPRDKESPEHTAAESRPLPAGGRTHAED